MRTISETVGSMFPDIPFNQREEIASQAHALLEAATYHVTTDVLRQRTLCAVIVEHWRLVTDQIFPDVGWPPGPTDGEPVLPNCDKNAYGPMPGERTYTGTKCSACGSDQYRTPSGNICCVNGHGGEPQRQSDG